MVIKVKLEGLNIVKSRGRYYVYVRETGEKLLGGFEGTRQQLLSRMAGKDFLASYNRRRRNDADKWDEGTLGALVAWFINDCAKFTALSEATKKDYQAAYEHLRPVFDTPTDELDQATIYELRDACAKERKGRFADKMVSALSSMFSNAVKQRKMRSNPALGVDKAHKARRNANREWTAKELENALVASPAHLRTVLMLARYAGFRGQTIHSLMWRDYQENTDPRLRGFEMCFRVVAGKNDEQVFVPCAPELQAYLEKIDKKSVRIATRANGTPWETEVQMQTEVSHFLRKLEEEGKIGADTTLHGLRVTYAAGLKRDGADTRDVAAALGDRSERMGSHYTRHVENEERVIRAFSAKKHKKSEQE